MLPTSLCWAIITSAATFEPVSIALSARRDPIRAARPYYMAMLTAHGVTHPGRVRATNEDAWHSALDLGLFIVADGMGGQNAGEVASSLAVDAIRRFVTESRESGAVAGPFGADPSLSPAANRIRTALKLANQRVFEAADNDDLRRGMGTTVVTALIEQNRLIYAGVGDSRIYSSRGGQLRQLTADDSWVSQLLANQPEVDRALLRHHPLRSVLTNVIGPKETLEVTVQERPLENGEVLLFCSDGLHGALADDAIGEVLASGADAAVMAERLVATALEGPAADNITALVIRYEA
jgi:protein phosphatase